MGAVPHWFAFDRLGLVQSTHTLHNCVIRPRCLRPLDIVLGPGNLDGHHGVIGCLL